MGESIFFWIKAVVLILLGICFWGIALAFILAVTTMAKIIVYPLYIIYQKFLGGNQKCFLG